MEGQDGGSSTLEAFVGDAFGDFSNGETPAGSESGDAAAPPAELPPDNAESTDGPEGTTDAERPGTPPEAAAATPPDALPVDDPFAGAKPATYTVDGQERTYDGIKVLGEDFGGRAIIEAEQLPDVLRRLGERDHLVTVNQRQFQERQSLEPLTSWKTTGDDGKDVTLTGQQGLTAMHVDYARQSAALTVIDAILSDPAKAIQLVELSEDGKSIVWSPTALEYLTKDVRLAANDVEKTTRRSLQSAVTDASKPAPVPIDYAAEAPAIIKAAAGADLSKLTPEDHTFLAAQLRFYTKDTTVDASYTALVQDRIARNATLAKTGTAITDASKQNAAKLAAAARGKPSAPKAVKPSAQQQHETTRVSDADAGFDLLSRLTSPRRAG